MATTVLDELLVKLGFDADASGADLFDSKLGGIIKTAGKVGLAIGGVGAVAAGFLGKSLLDTASQFEQFKTQLTTIEGSSEKAQKSLDWISEFAKKTPYELAGVTDAFVKLKAYGFDPTSGLLEDLGNASAGLGKDIMQGVEAIADAVNGQNERLIEAFNIKAADAGGGKVRYNYTDVKTGEQKFKEATKGNKVEIEKALREILQENYAGGMDAMSKTWEGVISNMKDAWAAFLMQIAAAGVFDALKGGLVSLMDCINNNGDKIQATARAIADAFKFTFEVIGDTYRFIAEKIQWIDDNSQQIIRTLQIIGVVAAIIAGALAIMYAPVIAGFIAMRVVALTSFLIMQAGAIASALATAAAWMIAFAPFLLIAALVASAIYAFWWLYQNWGMVANNIKLAWDNFVTSFNMGVEQIKAWWQGVVNAIKSWWDNAVNSVKATFANAIGALTGIWSGFWSGAQAIALGVINTVIGAIQRIVSAISDAFSKLQGLAKYNPISMGISGAKWAANKLSGGNSSSVNQTFNVKSSSEATNIARNSLSGHRARNTGVLQ